MSKQEIDTVKLRAEIRSQGRTEKWVAEQIVIHPVTFSNYIKSGKFPWIHAGKIKKILGISFKSFSR